MNNSTLTCVGCSYIYVYMYKYSQCCTTREVCAWCRSTTVGAFRLEGDELRTLKSNYWVFFFCIAKHKRRSFHVKTGRRSERKAEWSWGVWEGGEKTECEDRKLDTRGPIVTTHPHSHTPNKLQCRAQHRLSCFRFDAKITPFLVPKYFARKKTIH